MGLSLLESSAKEVLGQYVLLIFSLLTLMLLIVNQTDSRAGERDIFRKTRIKNHAFKKFLVRFSFFQEDASNPLLYIKVIPVFIQFFICVGVIIFYCFYWFTSLIPAAFFHSWGYLTLCIVATLNCLWVGILKI